MLYYAQELDGTNSDAEQNSKYFLNLEKRNHVKKHERKLHISGVISTDPFMFMESQRTFYMNLYRSRNVNLDNAESSIFFDSPNLPSISHESRIIFLKLINNSSS